MWAKVCRVLAMFAVTWLVFAVMCPWPHSNRENARVISCASNLKQLGVAITQYSEDNDDCLPPYASADGKQTWREEIYPFVKSTGVYKCPDDDADDSQATSQHLPHSYAANYSGTYSRDQGRGMFIAPGARPLSWKALPHPESLICPCRTARPCWGGMEHCQFLLSTR